MRKRIGETISVVICTRDRALKLEQCLSNLSEIDHDLDLEWQLVIVDNGSEDGTRAVIERFARSLPIKYVFEARRGLSYARNRGIAEAQSPIIAFTDDDCLVGSDWMNAITAEFAKRPELSILGGRVELADTSDYPLSIRIHDQAEQITTIDQIMTMMSGCNLAFRRNVFDAVGAFDPGFGKGTRIGSAEDIDLLYRALKAGNTIAYSPDVVVRHAHGRNTPEALDRVTGEYVKGRGAFYCKFIGDRQIARIAYWEVRSLLKERLRLLVRARSRKVLRLLATGAFYQCLDGMLKAATRAGHRSTH